MLKKIILAFLVLTGLVIVYFVLAPSPIDPFPWEPPEAPKLEGKYAVNNKLANVEILFNGKCLQCEDVAVDSLGRIFGGDINGNIMVFEDGKERVFAKTGGRPLGLHFDHEGNLIVADADKGLLSINQKGEVDVLVDEFEGKKLIFVDDLEVAGDSMIYFSDASNKFSFHQSTIDILEGQGNGSLYAYNPRTKTTKRLLDDLRFANGIAVAHDQSYVLVNETGRYRTHRYWLNGPKIGQSEIFIENLPGFPDGISQGKDGVFWLAIVTPRDKGLDDISNSVFLKNIIAKLPKFLQPAPVRYGFVLGLNGKGEVIYNFQDPEGKFAEITSVQQFGDNIYLGTLKDKGIGKYFFEK